MNPGDLYNGQVSFEISQKTLERLEWSQILERLAERARTPRARARLDPDAQDASAPGSLFESDVEGVRERLAETSEARAMLARGDLPPLEGVVDLGEALLRARKGSVLSARELLDLGATLAVLRGSRRFLMLRNAAELVSGFGGKSVTDGAQVRAAGTEAAND